MNDSKRPWTNITLLFGLISATAALLAGAAFTQAAQAADHPQLSGNWDNGAGIDFVAPVPDGASICVRGCAANPQPAYRRQRPSYRPEFQARVEDLKARQTEEDSSLHCFSPGVPRLGPPDKIVQTADEMIFLYDDLTGNFFRVIPTDGRPHRTDVEPSYLGDAIGWWEDDTLVVETVNFNDETWLIDDGSFHTTSLRVIEKIRRDGDSIEWRATAYDPEVLQEPFELMPRTAHLTNSGIAEAAPCIERDMGHLVEPLYHDNAR